MGPKPKITGCGIKVKEDERFKSWNKAEKEPDETGKRKLLTEALKIGLEYIMEHHVYQFDNVIKHQENGGAIGVELTGVLANVFMRWWDVQFKEKLEKYGINIIAYKRFVDDINIVAEGIEENKVYTNGIKEIESSTLEYEYNDRRTMELLKIIGNEIHPSIQITIECPSNFNDNKMPMLDIKVWLEYDETGRPKVMHEYYYKAITSKALIHAKSAMDWKMKRTVLTQQIITILRNCSKELSWEKKCHHVTDMVKRLQFSGYDKKFRYEVVNSAINAYKIMEENDRNKIKHMYRTKAEILSDRNKTNNKKKENWFRKGGYQSIIFVQATDNSKLKKEYENVIQQSKLKIKIVEKTGKSLIRMLQISDPFKKENCERQDCHICKSGGNGKCYKQDVTYKIECLGCGHEQNGETSNSAYTRVGQHMNDLLNDNVHTFSSLKNHCENKHQGVRQEFKSSVTKTFKDDPMKRQITEAVKIKAVPTERSMNSRQEWNIARLPQVIIT